MEHAGARGAPWVSCSGWAKPGVLLGSSRSQSLPAQLLLYVRCWAGQGRVTVSV